MRKIASIIALIYRALETGLSRIAAGIIILMMLLTTADVVGRYVFNSPIVGAYEISEVMLVGIVFLGIAYVQSVKGHVKVDMVTSWLPQRAQLTLDVFGYAAALAIMALITYRSGVSAWTAWVIKDHTMGLIQLPLWPGKSLVPLGAGLLCLRLIHDIASNSSSLLHRAIK